MNTPLYLLRAFQMGIHMADLERLEFGMLIDMFTESSNDTVKYQELASQSDFDKF